MVNRVEPDTGKAGIQSISDPNSVKLPEFQLEDPERRRILEEKMKFAYPEITALLLLFALGLSSAVFKNLLMESFCMMEANMTEANCSQVNLIPTHIQDIIQPQVNVLLNWKVQVETFVPALCVLFMGPWSDNHGRRPILLMSLGGYTLSYLILTLLTIHGKFPASFYLLASIPIGLTGGTTGYFLAIICFVTDVTTTKTRARKMGTLEAGCMFGSLFSQLLAAKVAEGPYGFPVTFGTSGIFCFINFLYILFLIPESADFSQNNREQVSVSVIDLVKSFVKKRPNYNRVIMYFLITANLAFIICIFGESDIFYQSAIKRFHWSLEQFSYFNSISITLSGVILSFGTYIMISLLKMTDITAALVCVTPRMVSTLLYAIASSDMYLYVATIIGSPAALITPFYRTSISKIIPADELGRIFAIIMFTEALIPMGASSVYTYVYNRTLETYPGAIFFLSFGLSILTFVMLLFVFIMRRYYPEHEHDGLPTEDTVTTTDTVQPSSNSEAVNYGFSP